MLREYRKTLILASLVTILPVVIGILFWNRLPDMMATHFGFDNEANGFSSKPFAVFGIPLFCLVLLWIAAFITGQDPAKKNVSPKIVSLCMWIVPVVSLFCCAMIYPYNLGYRMDTTRIVSVLMGLMFVIIGNYLPKTRQNYTIGIKVPWTLASEENWNRTHRFGGRLWVVCGLIILLLALAGIMQPVLLTALFLIIAFVPCIYSYWLYRKNVPEA